MGDIRKILWFFQRSSGIYSRMAASYTPLEARQEEPSLPNKAHGAPNSP